MRLLLLALLIQCTIAAVQYYYQRPVVYRRPQNTVYRQKYPIRVNCQPQCNNRNRYRPRSEFVTIAISRPVVNVVQRPLVRPQVLVPVTTQAPQGPTWKFTFTQPPTTTQTLPTPAPSSTTIEPSTSTTERPTTTSTTMTSTASRTSSSTISTTPEEITTTTTETTTTSRPSPKSRATWTTGYRTTPTTASSTTTTTASTTAASTTSTVLSTTPFTNTIVSSTVSTTESTTASSTTSTTTSTFAPTLIPTTVTLPSTTTPTFTPTLIPTTVTLPSTVTSTEKSSIQSTTMGVTVESTTEETTTLPTPPPEPTTEPPSSPLPDSTSAETTRPTTLQVTTPTTKFMRPQKKITTRPKFFNPCPFGRSLTNEFDVPVQCNHLNTPNGGCPEDHWCHTGASFATTACCPKADETSVCEQRRDGGEGSELVARWYFDKQNKLCKRFLYKGIRGNANNFVTKAQCIDACETAAVSDLKNPCRFSEPSKYRNGSRVLCGPADDSACPVNTFCHLGENPETTACCEASGLTDPCLLSLNVGQGKSLLKRFYYNTFSKRCTEFMYRGLKGNENNFLSFSQCQQVCQKWNNPCPTVVNFAQKKICTLNGTVSDCSAGQWCHVGATQDSTVCCPGATLDPCSQPMETGQGSESLTRWYADPLDKSCNGQCISFTYTGTKGNQNNFASKALCEQKCKRECKSPCGSGSMLMTPKNTPRLCSPTTPCPNTHWCHVGITPDATVCCSAVPGTCELPLIKGSGNSHLTRWHFDRSLNKCFKFIYSGEGGNQNMFLTQEDCQTVCPSFDNPCSVGKPLMVGSTPKVCSPSERCPSTHFCHIGNGSDQNYCCQKNGDPCDQPLTSGTGGLALIRYFYDKESRRCREFAYQGTKGNANNFLSIADCELVCPVIPNPCRQGEPLLNGLKEPVICGGEESCQAGYFCHIGGAPETTNCCPGRKSPEAVHETKVRVQELLKNNKTSASKPSHSKARRPCDLPLQTGEGREKLDRWFYDGSVQMCRGFVYRGMKGNSNNFLTKQACRQSCKEINPCGYGEPLVTTEGDQVMCTGGQKINSCPRGFFCHVGGSALTTICCPTRNIDKCDQPVEQGAGNDDLPRWFYDRKQNRCAPFNYGGLEGNENNFISLSTCQTECPEYRNYCPHGIPLIEGDQVTGCGIDRGCPEGFICHMSSEYDVSICCQDPMDFCLAPRDPGPCTNTESRYGYNAATDTCVEYKYGGCEGTLNNFRSLQRCTEICCKEYKRKH